jgi:integrase
MPAGRPRSVPSYRKHKQSGQAVVCLTDGCGNRRDVLLGPYGSKESRLEYARVISEWESCGRRPPPDDAAADLTMNELMVAYLRHADQYYRDGAGAGTGEADNIRQALRWVKRLYGDTPAAGFTPAAFKAIRSEMVRAGHARATVNRRTGIVKRMLKWTAGEGMVPPAVFLALGVVSGLRRGRSGAKELPPVRPVAAAHVDATLPHLSPTVAAMVRLQLATGARPGEICALRGCDLDVSGNVWKYTVPRHKTAYRGRERVVWIGPEGQAALRPFLRLDLTAHVFSPAEAREQRYAELRSKRKTPVQPSQQNRKKRRPERSPGECYDRHSYRRAVARAVAACNEVRRQRAAAEGRDLRPDERVPKWAPNQLRHAAATRIRKQFGLEAAGAALGHARMSATEIYAEKDASLACGVAAKIG